MAATENNLKSNQKSGQGSEAAGKYLANLLYVAALLFVLGFIWQSIAPFIPI